MSERILDDRLQFILTWQRGTGILWQRQPLRDCDRSSSASQRIAYRRLTPTRAQQQTNGRRMDRGFAEQVVDDAAPSRSFNRLSIW